MHTNTMRLHHGRLSIAVNNQSGEVVSLTMHQTVSIVQWIVSDTNSLSHLKS